MKINRHIFLTKLFCVSCSSPLLCYILFQKSETAKAKTPNSRFQNCIPQTNHHSYHRLYIIQSMAVTNEGIFTRKLRQLWKKMHANTKNLIFIACKVYYNPFKRTKSVVYTLHILMNVKKVCNIIELLHFNYTHFFLPAAHYYLGQIVAAVLSVKQGIVASLASLVLSTCTLVVDECIEKIHNCDTQQTEAVHTLCSDNK